MADPSPSSSSFPPWSLILFKLLSKRRTWACLFLLTYSLLISSSWSLLLSIRSWYSSSSPNSSPLHALYASILYGLVFGLISMGAALAVAVPATVVTWITVLVMLAFFGKPRHALVDEARKATKEIVSLAVRVLLREGNLAAIVCAVASFVAMVLKRSGENGESGGGEL